MSDPMTAVEAQAAVDDLCARLNAYDGDDAVHTIVMSHPASRSDKYVEYPILDGGYNVIPLVDGRLMLCDWWANWTIWGQVTRGVAKERNR